MKKKNIYIIIIVLIVLLGIAAFIIFKKSSNEKTILKEFLTQYYTVDEVVPENFITEEYVDREIERYEDFFEEDSLEKFIMSRTILWNKQYSSDNQCTISVEKIKITTEESSKTKKKFDYKVDLKLLGDNIDHSASAKGEVYMEKLDGKPRITYFNCTQLAEPN